VHAPGGGLRGRIGDEELDAVKEVVEPRQASLAVLRPSTPRLRSPPCVPALPALPLLSPRRKCPTFHPFISARSGPAWCRVRLVTRLQKWVHRTWPCDCAHQGWASESSESTSASVLVHCNPPSTGVARSAPTAVTAEEASV
jgi:hypothetical protein